MTKAKHEPAPVPLEEIARRMLALPVKTREEMTQKKVKRPTKKR